MSASRLSDGALAIKKPPSSCRRRFDKPMATQMASLFLLPASESQNSIHSLGACAEIVHGFSYGHFARRKKVSAAWAYTSEFSIETLIRFLKR